MLTFQDFEKVRNDEQEKIKFISQAISEHIKSDDYKTAQLADEYIEQSGKNIKEIIRVLFNHHKYDAQPVVSDYFYRLIVQRVAYSLGNGITFTKEETKDKLGKKVDNKLFEAGIYALAHKYAVLFFNYDTLEVFELTEYVPLEDEDTGAIRAGIRFRRLDENKPVNITLYEEDGYERYRGDNYSSFELVEEKKPYKQNISRSVARGEKVTGGENYSKFPFVKLYGTRRHQSAIIGLKGKIDMYDLTQSGFVDNVATAQQIIWLFENAGGMRDEDFKEFRNNLFFNGAANVNTAMNGAKVTPHQITINPEAHEKCLATLRASIYEDFGALDVHTITAGATNDHIDAAYQPVDLMADDFEYQIIEAVEYLLSLVGVEGAGAVPLFSRNKITNKREYVEMILMCAQYLDEETLLKKLEILTPDELEEVIKRKGDTDVNRFGTGGQMLPQ